MQSTKQDQEVITKYEETLHLKDDILADREQRLRTEKI